MNDYISDSVSESLSEYLIGTEWIGHKPERVSLEAKLGLISLQYPYITARMQCVVGPKMSFSAGRNGILTMVPRSLPDEEKQKILDSNNDARLKKGDLQIVSTPEFAHHDFTLEQTINIINRTGHSVIPVLDKQMLIGIYSHNPDNPLPVPWTPITEMMDKLKGETFPNGIPYLVDTEDADEIKRILSSNERSFVPIVDDAMNLQRLAFLQRYDTNFIGIAVNTRGDWKGEIHKWAEQVDTLCTDSSNICFDDALKILKYVKESKELRDKPFGFGNIIHGRHYRKFAEAGADYLIAGMGVGSICKTGSKRGNGRGQMTVALDIARERDRLAEETNGRQYVPFVLDGGIETVHEISVALGLADFVMMGNYFNRFYEAAAKKFTEKDGKKELTLDEANIDWVETWGEGHPRARLVAMCGIDLRKGAAEGGVNGENVVNRYGHTTVSSATVEGVLGYVKYRGRLKPCVEEDARYVKTTIQNAGAGNLETYKKNVREYELFEKASGRTMRDMLPHGIEVAAEE